MKTVFTVLMIIFLAFSGYHLSFKSFRLPGFALKFYLTGIEFLFIGILMSSSFLNLLDTQTLKSLEPVSGLILGWIGLIYGFQFEIKKIKRFSFDFFLSTLIEGFITFSVVFFGVYFLLSFLNLNINMKIMGVLTIAAASACSAQTSIVLFTSDGSYNKKVITLLKYISSIDGLHALLIFCAVFLIQQPVYDKNWLIYQSYFILYITGVPLVLCYLYLIFFSNRIYEKTIAIVIIGMVLISSGAALIINFSPLLINFFLGFCIVNISRKKEYIFNLLISIEKPVYLLLLVFLGASIKITNNFIFLIAAIYSVYRLAGKMTGGLLITKISKKMSVYPANLGFGLIDSGGLAFAILYDFQKRFPCEATTYIITIALISIVYNNFLSFFFLKRLLSEDSGKVK